MSTKRTSLIIIFGTIIHAWRLSKQLSLNIPSSSRTMRCFCRRLNILFVVWIWREIGPSHQRSCSIPIARVAWNCVTRLQDWPGRILTYSVNGASLSHDPVAFEAFDVRLDGETSFRVRVRAGAVFPEDRVLHLQLPGVHNVENALAALAAARLIGVGVECIVKTLEGFGGTRRRFEIRHHGQLLQTPQGSALIEDVMLVDDYAHHPTAIQMTLEAARHRYPGRRLVAVYQPHMYSRTKTFFNQFLLAFDAADIAILSDIFPAREHDTGLIHTRDLVTALRKREHFASQGGHVLYGGSVTETADLLAMTIETGDLVIIMGAGDIYTVTEQLLQTWHLRGVGEIQMTFDVETAYNQLRAHLGEHVRRDEPLARHCTFGVGGPADIWVMLHTAECPCAVSDDLLRAALAVIDCR